MFAGGIADKLGNKYESAWLIRNFIDVLSADSAWIRTEGITKEFKGFEFAVGKTDYVEWHQTKISTGGGNWTIASLTREGVLQSFKSRFEANNNDKCYFVSEDPAKGLHMLASKAKIANDEAEFLSGLGKGHESNYTELLETWGVVNSVGFGWLQRSHFVVVPQSEIEAYTNSHIDLYFSAIDANNAAESLRVFLDTRLNKKICTETARAALRAEGKLRFKEWSLDPTLRERLRLETEAYLETYNPFGAGGTTIVRTQSAAAANHLTESEGPTVVLLTGVAGSGKSGVVRDVINQLREKQICHLALRIDHNLQYAKRSSLGKALTDREESPAATLKGLEPNNLSVLVIDQVDAVSEVSGRNGSVKEVVLQLIVDARAFRTVRVLIVCRSFDLESDRRLKTLQSSNDAVHIDIPLLDWVSDVEPLLLSHNLATGSLTNNQRSLLCLPLNLAIFLEIKGNTRPNFSSRNDLFEKLIEYKDRAIRRERPLSWGLAAPLIKLAEWMSERQRLDAPREVIAEYGGAMDLLSSEGILVKSRDRVNFFHESFFDYIYARAFAGKEGSITGLLKTSEQHLFRRTQVRQILETLRQSDTTRYERELLDVLGDSEVRFHIKAAVAQWLGSLPDPSPVERDAILPLDDGQERLPLLVRSAALGSPGWFDRLNEIGWIKDGLCQGQEPRVQAIKWWLSEVANDRPTQVISLLETWWGGDPARADDLIQWFSFLKRKGPNKEIGDFCERVIRSSPPGLFVQPGSDRRKFTIPFWVDDYTYFSSGTLEALFDVWFEKHPGRHPFERDELGDLDNHAFGELAKNAPEAFLQGTTAALVRSVNMICERRTLGERDYTFKHRTHSGHRFGADEFLGFYRNALIDLGGMDASKVNKYIDQINPLAHEVFTHIYLELISAHPTHFAIRLPEVLSSSYLFDAGWDGAGWKSFSDAAREALPYLGTAEGMMLEMKIFSHRPEIDFAVECAKSLKDKSHEAYYGRSTIMHYLNRSGLTQAYILSAIGKDRLTQQGAERLECLRRKFADLSTPEPHNVEVHAVVSPIKRKNIEKMKDEHWLSAMARYSTEEWKKNHESIYEGGAQQLASELHQLAKLDPERYGRLILNSPKKVNRSYVRNILWGLAEAENVSEKTLLDVIVFAHEICKEAFGGDIARIFEQHPFIARSKIALDILIWYINFGAGPPNEIEDDAQAREQSVKIQDLLERGGRLHIRGVNSDRGSAAEAFGSLLWSDVPGLADAAWEILENRINTEQSISVRSCLVRALLPLYNHDRRRAAALLERLAKAPKTASSGRDPDWVEGVAAQLMLPSQRLPKHVRRFVADRFLLPIKLNRKLSKLPKMDLSPSEPKWLSPLVSHQGISIMRYVLFGVSDIGNRLLLRLLACEDETTHLIGSWHTFRVAFQKSEYAPLADGLLKRGVKYRRLAADVAAGALTYDEFRDRAENQLIAFFNDTDKEVRAEAADTFRTIEADEFGRFYKLAEIYVESLAFEEQSSFSFLHKIEDATCDVYPLVIRVAERMIDDFTANGSRGGRRHSDLHQLQDLLKKEYAASERNSEFRSRLLDLIDTMLAQELYGADGVIVAHER